MSSRTRRMTTAVAGAAAISLLAACSSGGSSSSAAGGGTTSSPASTASASPTVTVVAGGSCSPNATKVLFWAWVPGMGRAVTEFNKTHPNICVTQEDVGAGNPEYVAITNALKAGSGAPDVAEVEFDELPSFEVTKNVVNLAPYGANTYKSKFTTWAWDEVSQGSGVYAMPGDAGPMAFYYNTKELAKYGLTPPTTWAEFATDAAKLHKANPNAYMTNFSAIDLQWVMSLMAQDNAWPFAYSGGSNVTINWTGPKQMAFASYWQNLLAAHEVNATTDVSATSFADLDKGIDAGWLSSAWGPSYFAPDAKTSLGNWRAAPLPQWTAGANVAANWGGSTYPVFSQSKHPGGSRVRRVAERHRRVVEHHQDGAVVAVPDVPAAAQQLVVQDHHRPAVRLLDPERAVHRGGQPDPGRAVAAVHDRGAHPVGDRVRRRDERQGDAPGGVHELPERPGDLRQGAGLHRLHRMIHDVLPPAVIRLAAGPPRKTPTRTEMT